MQLVSKIFNLCGHDPPTSQTDRQTDGQTTCDSKTALCTVVNRAVKMNEFLYSQAVTTYTIYKSINGALLLQTTDKK